MKPWIRLSPLLGLLVVAGSCGRDADPTLTVYAAASLTAAMETAAREFETARGVQVVVRSGSSGSLALAIERGAPADVFLSASEPWMDELEARELVLASTRAKLAGNRLAVVVPRGEVTALSSPEDLSRVGRLALGETSTVPAGIYAREALTHLGLWEELSGRCVEASNVRAALALVERHEVDAGVVYHTDALSSQRVTLAFLIPPEAHAPIRYPGAVLAGSAHPVLGRQFLDLLRSPTGRRILTELGFTTGDAP